MRRRLRSILTAKNRSRHQAYSLLEELGFEPSVPLRNDIVFERRGNPAFLYLGQSTTRSRYMTR